MWEDLQRQIRSLHVAVRESVSQPNPGANPLTSSEPSSMNLTGNNNIDSASTSNPLPSTSSQPTTSSSSNQNPKYRPTSSLRHSCRANHFSLLRNHMVNILTKRKALRARIRRLAYANAAIDRANQQQQSSTSTDGAGTSTTQNSSGNRNTRSELSGLIDLVNQLIRENQESTFIASTIRNQPSTSSSSAAASIRPEVTMTDRPSSSTSASPNSPLTSSGPSLNNPSSCHAFLASLAHKQQRLQTQLQKLGKRVSTRQSRLRNCRMAKVMSQNGTPRVSK